MNTAKAEAQTLLQQLPDDRSVRTLGALVGKILRDQGGDGHRATRSQSEAKTRAQPQENRPVTAAEPAPV